MPPRLALIWLAFGIVAEHLPAQDTVSVGGTVLDAETARPIAAVNVTVRGSRIGTSTDSLGYFQLLLPKGSYVIGFSHIAYKKIVRGLIADLANTVTWKVEMTSNPVQFSEVTVTARKPFSQQRAIHSLSGAEFERLAETDMDRAMRYLLPTIISRWDVRMRSPSKDFTLYVNGEWMESIYLTDIDPYSVQRVLVWEGEWSPVGLPLRRGKYVVSIETK